MIKFRSKVKEKRFRRIIQKPILFGSIFALLAFSRFPQNTSSDAGLVDGHVFVVFVLSVAAAEAAVALALSVLVYRKRETVDLDRINLMRW